MAIFNSYVSLPEGTSDEIYVKRTSKMRKWCTELRQKWWRTESATDGGNTKEPKLEKYWNLHKCPKCWKMDSYGLF